MWGLSSETHCQIVLLPQILPLHRFKCSVSSDNHRLFIFFRFQFGVVLFLTELHWVIDVHKQKKKKQQAETPFSVMQFKLTPLQTKHPNINTYWFKTLKTEQVFKVKPKKWRYSWIETSPAEATECMSSTEISTLNWRNFKPPLWRYILNIHTNNNKSKVWNHMQWFHETMLSLTAIWMMLNNNDAMWGSL